jgi:TRAP-type C4-dicarboxylate transport system permease small subunit
MNDSGNFVGILFIWIALFMFIQVLGRYVFHHSFSYSEEIVRYLFIWATFLGIAVAFKQREHIAVTLLPANFRERFASPYPGFSKRGAVFFLGILAWHGVQCAKMQWLTKQTQRAFRLADYLGNPFHSHGALLSIWMVLTHKPSQKVIRKYRQAVFISSFQRII